MKRREFISCSAARRRGRWRRGRSRGGCRPSDSWARAPLRPRQLDDRFCAAAPRAWLERGSHGRDRIPLGRGTQRARRRDRGRVRPAQGRRHRRVREAAALPQSRRHRSFRSSSRSRAIRSAAVSSRVWLDRAATSPAYRSRRPISPASGSNCCARSCPVSVDWQSSPMPEPRRRARDS